MHHYKGSGLRNPCTTDLEHLTGALAVRGGDDGSVHVAEAPLLEELVCGERQRVADARDRGQGVGARAQVHEATEELKREAALCLGEVRKMGMRCTQRVRKTSWRRACGCAILECGNPG